MQQVKRKHDQTHDYTLASVSLLAIPASLSRTTRVQRKHPYTTCTFPRASQLLAHAAQRTPFSLVSLRQPFWKFFEEVSSIPRASKHEAAVLAYVKGFAEDRGLPWREDDYGNVVIDREGMNGGEDAAKVVIQGTRALLLNWP